MKLIRKAQTVFTNNSYCPNYCLRNYDCKDNTKCGCCGAPESFPGD